MVTNRSVSSLMCLLPFRYNINGMDFAYFAIGYEGKRLLKKKKNCYGGGELGEQICLYMQIFLVLAPA